MELLTAYSMHSRRVNALACACWAGLSALAVSVLAVWPCLFSVSGVVRVAVSVLAVRPSGVIPCARTCPEAVSLLAVRTCVFSVSKVVRVAVSVLVVRPSGVIPCARICPEAVVAAEINVKTIIGIIGFIIRCCFP